MKKIFAAAMAAFVLALAGCEKAADEIVDDISETTSAATELSSTETCVTAETSAAESQAVPETTAVNNAAAEKFSVGKWIETRSYIYDFDENGNVTIDTGFYTLEGSYEYDGNALKLTFYDNLGTLNEFHFDVIFEEEYVRLKSTDYSDFTRGEEYICIPYDPVELVTGYGKLFLADTNEYRLTPYDGGLRDVTVDDFQGVWQEYYSEDQPADKFSVYYGDINSGFGSNIKFKIETDENGYFIDEDTNFLIEQSDGSYEFADYQRSFKMYGDTLFICDNYEDTRLYKRYITENVPEDYFNGSFSVHGFLEGEFSDFKNGIGQFTGTDGIVYNAELNVKDNNLYVTIGEETKSYECYFRKNSDDEYTLSFLDVAAMKNEADIFWSFIKKYTT